MIVRCPDCLTKYEIAAGRIPEDGVKVRCPKCKAVFPVNRIGADAPTPVAAAVAAHETPAPAPAPVSEPPSGNGELPRRPSRLITDPAVARRMARAVIQEMLLPRKPDHERALADNSLLSTFGAALAEANELYREKVSPDLPEGEAIFREAVNDILGKGRTIL